MKLGIEDIKKITIKPCPFCGGPAEVLSYPSKSSWEQYEPSTPALIGCTNEKCGNNFRVAGYIECALEKCLNRWQLRDGINPDSYVTLKMVIDIFEKASSVKNGLYDAQELVFERHPELEG